MIFSFNKSTSLGEGVRKTPKIIRGVQKMKGKNKGIIITHPLGKL